MKNIILIYIITQLITNAYGLSVIESIRPFVEQKLIDRGYHKNKNSLYRFNTTLSNILKGFIPFYYLTKAISIISKKGNYEAQIKEQIDNKNYVIEEVKPDIILIDEEEKEKTIDKTVNLDEKYKARKNTISLYEPQETQAEYIVKETKNNELDINPFIRNNKEVEKIIIKEEVTSKDIAKKICELNLNELELLKEQIKKLEVIKKDNKKLKLEKDVA